MKLKLVLKIILLLLFFVIISINIFSFLTIDRLQENNRIINYATLAQTTTQRLMKSEAANQPNDEMLQTLDDIVYKLVNQPNDTFPTEFEDSIRSKQLQEINVSWTNLKNEIYMTRSGLYVKDLSINNKQYANLLDHTIDAAELDSKTKFKQLEISKLFFLLTILLLAMICLHLFYKLVLLKKRTLKLEDIAFFDKQTGLPNRNQCDRIIKKYESAPLKPNLVCIYFDLNNLKQTNDVHGHHFGDQLICSFGKTLQETGYIHGFVGRNGGDEFLAIFENFSLESTEKYIAELKQIVDIFNQENEFVEISFAAGFSTSNDPRAKTIYDLLKIADQNMYENKRCIKKPLI